MIRKLFLTVTLGVCLFFWMFSGKGATVFYGDALGYYLYLPATFIYDNHKHIEEYTSEQHLPDNITFYLDQVKREAVVTPKGYRINQYTYGVALLESPFFFLAHGYEKLTGKPADGYSGSYPALIKLSAMFYTLLGLLILYRILKRYYPTNIAFAGTVLTLVATNLLWFSLRQAGMSHVPLFFLYALLMWLSIRVHEHPSAWRFAATGITAGLITIIRPTDILCLIIPFCYGVYNLKSFRARLRFLYANLSCLGIAAVAFVIPLIPQLVYWKYMTGNFLFYSYGSQTFDWAHPKIIEGLFFGTNGWFAYTPIMLLATAGMFMIYRIRDWSVVIWLLVPVYIYVVYSWYCYNYINGFGSRPMIHLYPLLALPLCAFIEFVSHFGRIYKTAVAVLCLTFVAMNVSYSMQAAAGLLRSEDSNNIYNLQILFKPSITYDDLVTMDNEEVQPDRSRVRELATLNCLSFDDSLTSRYERDTNRFQGFYYHYGSEEYGPAVISVSYNQQTFGQSQWLLAKGRFMTPYYVGYNKHLMVLEIKRDDKHLLWRPCKINNKIGLLDTSCGHSASEITLEHGEKDLWAPVSYFVRIPKDLRDGDRINLLIWNLARTDLYVDDFCLKLYR